MFCRTHYADCQGTRRYRYARITSAWWCHLRRDARLFRLDRVIGSETLEEVFERRAGMETPGAVLRAVAGSHGPWEVEVLLETSMERAREQVTPMLASLEETDGGVLMRCAVDDLDGMARFLAGLFCPFVVRRPPELWQALGLRAAELSRLAEAGGTRSG